MHGNRVEKTDGGKSNGNISGKKCWQIHGRGKTTGGKFNSKISAKGKSSWHILAPHVATKKGKLVLRANAKATKLAKLWPKLWQGPKTGRVRVSAKSLGKADQEGTLHGPMILYAAVGLHKRLLTLFYMKRK